jgi:hypothetical protein
MSAAFRTFLAVTLGVVTVAAAEKAATYQTGAQWLLVLLLAVATFVALCAAGTAIVAAVWFGIRYALYERRLAARIRECAPPRVRLGARHALPEPERLPELNGRTLARDARAVDYYGDDALTEARQASAAAEQGPVRNGLTVPLPNPWRAGPVELGYTLRVVDAQAGPWTPVGGAR